MNSNSFGNIPFLSTDILNNSVLAWLSALLVFLFLFLILRTIRRVVTNHLQKSFGGTQDLLILELVTATNGFVLLIVALSISALFVALPEPADGALKTFLVITLIVQAGVWGSKVVTSFLVKYLRSRGEEDASSLSAISLLTFVAQFVIWGIVVLLVLENLNVDVTALVAGLGIGGIAVALAVQNILGDLLASLSIVLDKPFVVGDFIIVGDVLGSVEKIGIKTSRIRSLSGEQIIFPNSDLLSSRVRNFKRMFERRIVFSVGVVYNTPESQVQKIPLIIREAIESQEKIRVDRVHFKSFGDFALIFEAVYYVLAPEYNLYMDIQQSINLIIYKRFTEEKIEFAFPTQTLFIESGSQPFLVSQQQMALEKAKKGEK